MTSIFRTCIVCALPVVACLIISGCRDGSSATTDGTVAATNDTGTATTASSTATTASGTATTAGSLSISGQPAASIAVDASYDFMPKVSGAAAAPVFSIQNKPAWAAFNTTTGALTGKPTALQEGMYSKIEIRVIEGVNTAVLPAFSIQVTAAQASVNLLWVEPVRNTDGTTMMDLAAYHIYFGLKASSLDKVLTVIGAANTTYTVANLAPGTWYFAIAAVNKAGVESDLTEVVPVVI
ncbi:MAG: fibronectin type III domain-containing protein [Gammaproteobacteria bacterium]